MHGTENSCAGLCGCVTWCMCPARLCTHGPHTTKSAQMCSGIGKEERMGCTWPSKLPREWSCMFAHILIFRIQGCIEHLKVHIRLLRPQRCVALWGTRGRSVLSSELSPKGIWYRYLGRLGPPLKHGNVAEMQPGMAEMHRLTHVQIT
jgi:hypothetical protein